MLHMLKKGEYPDGFYYWSNSTADLFDHEGNIIEPEDEPKKLPMQLKRALEELYADGTFGVRCYLVEWDGHYAIQLEVEYDQGEADAIGVDYRTLVDMARARAIELNEERSDLHIVFAEDVWQWDDGDPVTETWLVMPWDMDVEEFNKAGEWFGSRCYVSE